MAKEYTYWQQFFSSEEFKINLLRLKHICKNKKVVLYSNGIYFEALADNYNLKDFFNIVGISDIKYEKQNIENFKGFTCINPNILKIIDFNVLIITSPNPVNIKKYLLENKIISRKIKILNLQLPEKNLLFNFFTKVNLGMQYFNKTNSILKSVKYSIYCDTTELQTKINYEKKLIKLKEKKQYRILFVCEENSKWNFQYLYDLLKKDEKFKVLPILLFPIITSGRIEFTQNENKEFFEKLGIETIDGYDYENECNKDIKTFEPDIVFYQQPWYLQGNNHPKIISEYALTAMGPYGYTTLSGDCWGSDLVKEVYSNLWCFFSESSYHNKFYENFANMKHKDNLVVTGSPKLDAYKLQKSETNNKKPLIIWAPHHSITNSGLKMGTFNKNCIFFLNLAKQHVEYDFVLKPHPALKNVCIESGFFTEKEYNKYMKNWNDLPNTKIYTSGNYIELFQASDLLITDCSSFLAEYFPTLKPIIFLNREDRAPFDSFGEKLTKGFYTINSTDRIEKLIKNLMVDKSDNLLSTRKNIMDTAFYIPKTSAAQKIINHVKEYLS